MIATIARWPAHWSGRGIVTPNHGLPAARDRQGMTAPTRDGDDVAQSRWGRHDGIGIIVAPQIAMVRPSSKGQSVIIARSDANHQGEIGRRQDCATGSTQHDFTQEATRRPVVNRPTQPYVTPTLLLATSRQ